MTLVRARLLSGFDDPACMPQRWEQLLRRGDTDVVFLTWHWLRAWWETCGEGQLLLVAAERQGELVALAPWYVHGGMIYFLGVGESDYLDFVGDVGDPHVLKALLQTAQQHVPVFHGFEFHNIPEQSRTLQWLPEAAGRIGLEYVPDRFYRAVEVDLVGQAERVRTATERSMRKREESFRRRGSLAVWHVRDWKDIRPHLPDFYAQHVARWQVKEFPSPFVEPQPRAFLERFLELADPTGWVRFLRLEWDGRPLAFEFAWYYRGTHFSAPWCFAIEQARHSPGHVLLRQSLLAALAEGLHTYDLGRGDQEYKFRLPARVKSCHTVGLYEP